MTLYIQSFRRLIILSLIITFFIFAFSVDSAALDKKDSKGIGYSSVLYNSGNGLPTSEANTIIQSRDGFIWIGGYSGLVRYDGNTFYRYESSVGISSVVALYEDSKGRLWIGTNDSGIAYMKDNVFTLFGQNEGLSSLSIRAITEDESGNIIIASTRGLAYIDENDDIHLINDPRINEESIRYFVSDGNGRLYGNTLSGCFFTVEDLRVGVFFSGTEMGLGMINTVCPGEEPGSVYLGTQADTVFYGSIDGGFKEINRFSVDPYDGVNEIKLFDGTMWVCTDRGIGVFGDNGEFIPLDNLPMTHSVDRVIRDHEGNMWFSSSRQGVMKIVENRFIDIFEQYDLDEKIVNSTCFQNGVLYVGTDNGLIIIGQDGVSVANELTSLLDNVRIRCIKTDRNGVIWLCTYSDHSLVSYDPKTEKIKSITTEDGLASKRVRTLTELSDGRLAVATNGGLNLITDGVVTGKIDASNGISNLDILCVAEGPDGKLYLGSDGDGLYIVEGTAVTRRGIDDGLRSEVIMRIVKDPFDDIYWLITSNSIAYMKDEKITTLSSFPYSNNFDMYFGSDEKIWVMSSNGVYVVRREVMLADENMEYTFFDGKCGLPCVATANSYSCLTDDGKLYIAGTSGVSLVDISADADDGTENIRLSVPYVMSEESFIPIKDGEKVHIPANAKSVTLYPFAFTYSLNNPNLTYYLEGLDDEPVKVSKQELKSVRYTNLKHGTYKFHLDLISTKTGKPSKSVTVTLVKDAMFYETVWFNVLIALLGIAFVAFITYLFYHSREKKLLKKHAENRKMIDQMTGLLAKCVDMKDSYTNGHSFRVAKYTAMFAEKLGKSPEEVNKIYNIALLHDLGKISIPDNVLNKPGRLTDEEYAIMKSHSAKGRDILIEIDIEPDLALGAGYHHERYDGKGYPNGLAEDEIPEIAQMIAVADTLDAMYSTRPYRKQMALSDVVAEIKRVSGTQLSPRVVDVFLQLAEEGAFDTPAETPQLLHKEETV
ncbi:MAG: HD domain-containing protein [Clostridia bacterium]|nr:HD domain-containing protein [Clostridia bacterium]